MKQELILRLHSAFESSAKQTQDGPEFWFARDLQGLLGYNDWKNFERVIDKAKTACQNSGQTVADHFSEVGKMVTIGSGSQRQIVDIALTRYACYLVAQNGDSKKEEISFAQTYFAVQTRKQELIVQRLAEIERLGAREKLSLSEKELSGIIFERLGGDSASFARIRSKGDRALFNGLTTQEMKNRLGVPDNRALADFLPTITIKAKDFANEVTNTTIKQDNLNTEPQITKAHVKTNTDVRKILVARGIKPENLPASEDAKRLERRLLAEAKKLPKSIKSLKSGHDSEEK